MSLDLCVNQITTESAV